MKKQFTSEDIIQKRNLADLGEYGGFRGYHVEVDPENPSTIRAYGVLILSPRHLEWAEEIDGTLEIDLEKNPYLDDIADLAAGEIFIAPWRSWRSEDIPADWEF